MLFGSRVRKVSNSEFFARFQVRPELLPTFKSRMSFSVKATDTRTGREVMLRIVPANGQLPPPSDSAVRRLKQIRHPQLTGIEDYMEVMPGADPAQAPGFMAMVLQHFEHPSIKDMLAASKPIPTMEVVMGALSGLEALHSKRLIHGNLRPSNIILQNIGHVHVRLSHYGLVSPKAAPISPQLLTTSDLAYLSPEQIAPGTFGKGGKIRPNSDFWALGIILYEIFVGQHPFKPSLNTPQDLVTAITAGKIPDDIQRIAAPYRRLIQACLTRHAAERPRRVAELRQILRGEILWEDGRAVAPPPSQPVPVVCAHCGQTNSDWALTCNNCQRALRGPVFLQGYRRTGAVGFWVAFFISLAYIPIAFFYFGYYETFLASKSEWAWLRDLIQKIAEGPGLRGMSREVKEALTVALVIVGLFFIVTALLHTLFFWWWYSRLYRNHAALGAYQPRFHPIWLVLADIALIIGTIFVPAYGIGLILVFAGRLLGLFAMQEVWRGSNPTYLVEGEQWRKSRGSFMLFSWWAAGLAWPILLLLPILAGAALMEQGETQAYLYWAAVIVGVMHWWLSVAMVMRVGRRQRAKFYAWIGA